MVTAGLVHNPGGEASLGTANEKLLREVCAVTGGSCLDGGTKIDLGSAKARSYVELWPHLVVAVLLLFLIDIGVRRWEHVTGILGLLRVRR